MNESFFNKIEQKTGVKMDDVFALANAVQYADFTDEKQVKKIVRQVSKLANKALTRDLEAKIVETIVTKGNKLNFQEIQSIIKESK